MHRIVAKVPRAYAREETAEEVLADADGRTAPSRRHREAVRPHSAAVRAPRTWTALWWRAHTQLSLAADTPKSPAQKGLAAWMPLMGARP